jgi:hypothetical protein
MNQTSLKWFATTANTADPFESTNDAKLSTLTSSEPHTNKILLGPDKGQSKINWFATSGDNVDQFRHSDQVRTSVSKRHYTQTENQYIQGLDQPKIKWFASKETSIDPFEALERSLNNSKPKTPHRKMYLRYLWKDVSAGNDQSNTGIYQPDIIDMDGDILDVDSDYDSSDSEIFLLNYKELTGKRKHTLVRHNLKAINGRVKVSGSKVSDVPKIVINSAVSLSNEQKSHTNSPNNTSAESQSNVCQGGKLAKTTPVKSSEVLDDLIAVWDNATKSSAANTPHKVVKSENSEADNQDVCKQDDDEDRISFFHAVQQEERLHQDSTDSQDNGLLGYTKVYDVDKADDPTTSFKGVLDKENQSLSITQNTNRIKRKSDSLDDEQICQTTNGKKPRYHQPNSSQTVSHLRHPDASELKAMGLDCSYTLTHADLSQSSTLEAASAVGMKPPESTEDNDDDDICVVWQSQTPGM